MKKTKLVSQLRVDLEKGLKQNGHTKAKKIEIRFEGTEVVVQGRVESYYTKQMVLAVVAKIAGGFTITDAVTVD